MITASFAAEVTEKSAEQFAKLSGDWNPLHTDSAYAASTDHGKIVLHGAFSAGLVSRLAGMELPGRECLLHSMRLRFVAPLFPPATLLVHGRLVSGTREMGKVDVTVSDATSGNLYVEASYEFSRHTQRDAYEQNSAFSGTIRGTQPLILVTGATGGVGSALVEQLGERALGVSRQKHPHLLCVESLDRVGDLLQDQPLLAIVHCAWPLPDNRPLLELPDPRSSIDYQVAEPVRQIQALARLLSVNGTERAPLLLVGSSFAKPGRHNYRMPLYSLSKSMIPALVQILAVELSIHGKQCIGVEFDVIAGGMNRALNRVALAAHADRTLFGSVPSPQDVAAQICWILDNPNTLATGATLTLTGGAIP
ncbi:MAG: SDR family oxidoreductase [Magnetococcales bacterium]|nr:SDR family oxidoreductase [Magnetococcales bacterium]